MSKSDEGFQGQIVAVFNTASGSWTASAESQTREIFSRAGLHDVELISAAPADIEAALKDAVTGADVLVILGGDGTIGTAARLCGPDGPSLIPLPGGTMNMLPGALYDTSNWRDALTATVADPVIRVGSGGDAAGHPFYCAAILGAPSLWADAREALRAGRLIEGAKRAVTATRRSLSDSINYQFDEVSGSAEAVAVICPLISQDMMGDALAFEAVALDPSTTSELFGLAFHAAFDRWRDDEAVVREKVTRVDVRAHGEIPLILDGEKVKIDRDVKITFVPQAFRALVPRHTAKSA